MAKPQRVGKKWRQRWTDASGKRCSRNFDSKREASAFYIRVRAEVQRIKQGEAHPRPKNKTCEDLFTYWIDKRAVTKRSGNHDVSIIRCHLRPHLGNVRLIDLSVAHIDDLKLAIAHLAPKTVRNILTLLGSVLNVGVELNWLEKVPTLKKPSIDVASMEFSYLHNAVEIKRFLGAAKRVNERGYRLFKLAVFTGMRLGELAALKWSDIDFEQGVILVKHSFSDTTKSNKARVVPILKAIQDELMSWHQTAASLFVCPTKTGTMLSKSNRLNKDVLYQTLERAGFKKWRDRRGKEHRYIRFHDLRHTFASFWMRNGGDIFRLQKILGHSSPQMTMRYAHLAPDCFTEDLNRFDSLRADN